jgi:hypothetical protein
MGQLFWSRSHNTGETHTVSKQISLGARSHIKNFASGLAGMDLVAMLSA